MRPTPRLRNRQLLPLAASVVGCLTSGIRPNGVVVAHHGDSVPLQLGAARSVKDRRLHSAEERPHARCRPDSHGSRYKSLETRATAGRKEREFARLAQVVGRREQRGRCIETVRRLLREHPRISTADFFQSLALAMQRRERKASRVHPRKVSATGVRSLSRWWMSSRGASLLLRRNIRKPVPFSRLLRSLKRTRAPKADKSAVTRAVLGLSKASIKKSPSQPFQDWVALQNVMQASERPQTDAERSSVDTSKAAAPLLGGEKENYLEEFGFRLCKALCRESKRIFSNNAKIEEIVGEVWKGWPQKKIADLDESLYQVWLQPFLQGYTLFCHKKEEGMLLVDSVRENNNRRRKMVLEVQEALLELCDPGKSPSPASRAVSVPRLTFEEEVVDDPGSDELVKRIWQSKILDAVEEAFFALGAAKLCRIGSRCGAGMVLSGDSERPLEEVLVELRQKDEIDLVGILKHYLRNAEIDKEHLDNFQRREMYEGWLLECCKIWLPKLIRRLGIPYIELGLTTKERIPALLSAIRVTIRLQTTLLRATLMAFQEILGQGGSRFTSLFTEKYLWPIRVISESERR